MVAGWGAAVVLSSSVTRRASETRRRCKRRAVGAGCRRVLRFAACASVGFPIVLRMPDDERTPASAGIVALRLPRVHGRVGDL